ncbi:methyl-accepting chemotaxis protein [Pelagicoccus sp. SDUM812003]|uniref:methyl-accepting chemotaxis protein n=1 Tax=Pelagicoccus sp. SDUM812003 TaxID=3041267 RepID=UPI00280CFB0A|nr:methyl-accepting chemotaxis protein [Pelagicoccus sp. SDUM812003]MDQ8204607.1 methyl-accepting chemotaxis protein [Pelagicoccus sp. SDUM812003]
MSLKARIFVSNLFIAVFALILATVLYVDHSSEVSKLRSFSKVSELLVLFIKTSESFAEESVAAWGASPTMDYYSQESVDRYEQQVELTNGLFDDIEALVQDLDKSQYSDRFIDMVQNELDFHAHVDEIRDGLRSGRVAAWPSVQRYVEEINWLIGLIPQLAIEAHDAELVRKMILADATMQLRLRTERHVGMMVYNLDTGEVTETVNTVSKQYLTDSQTLLSKIRANAPEDARKLIDRKITNHHWDLVLESTRLLIDEGVYREGINQPLVFDQSIVKPTEEAGAQVMAGIGSLKDFILNDIETYTKERLAEAQWYKWQAVALGLLCIGVCIGSGHFLASNLYKTIGSIADTLRKKADEGLERSRSLASSSQRLADGGAQQAASIEEISATMEEMKAISDTNEEHVRDAQAIARETDQTALQGSQAMDQMGKSMKCIEESSDQIADIAKSIEEIAFQTNILALNAAVEAARAGEAGAGFAIVAEEVRSLAHKSAGSANSTREKIETAIRSVKEGTRITEDVHTHLEKIVQQASRSRAALDLVAQSSSQQNSGIGQVTTSISEIDSVTQQNAASSEECSSTAQEMENHSQDLLRQIEKLERMLRGNARAGARPRPARGQPAPQLPATPSQKREDRMESVVLFN